MGWGTNFTTDIYLSRLTFNHRDEVQDLITENEKILESIRTRLKMMVIADIKTILPPDDINDPVFWVNQEVDSAMEAVEEISFLISRLRLYINYLDDNKITIIERQED